MPVAQWLILVMGLSTITPDSGESDRYDDDLRANGVAPPAGYAGDALDGYDGSGGGEMLDGYGNDGVGAEVAAATGNTAPRLANREHTPPTKLPVKWLKHFHLSLNAAVAAGPRPGGARRLGRRPTRR